MPRKTTKKVAAKKTAVKKAAPKRKKYQTGGTAKPQMPRSQALAMQEARNREEERLRLEEEQRMMAEAARVRAETEEMERRNLPPEISQQFNAAMERYRREQGLMELGNRQRAAAARARTRSRRGPTAAEQARNTAEYERAMRARQANLSRGSTPSPRPVPQPRPNPRPAPPSPVMNRQQYQQELQNRIAARPPATSINRGNGIASPAMRPPNYRPPVRPNPTVRDPSPTREANMFNQQMQAERRRIQQQIAQLQARLRQLGG